MAEISFPFDAGAGSATSEDGWGKMARAWCPDGVILLGGSDMGGLILSAGGGTRETILSAGRYMIQGFYYENTANKSFLHAANSSGNPRMDAIVVELDRVNNQATTKIVQGTPAGVAAPPTLTKVDGGVWQNYVGLTEIPNGASAVTDIWLPRHVANPNIVQGTVSAVPPTLAPSTDLTIPWSSSWGPSADALWSVADPTKIRMPWAGRYVINLTVRCLGTFASFPYVVRYASASAGAALGSDTTVETGMSGITTEPMAFTSTWEILRSYEQNSTSSGVQTPTNSYFVIKFRHVASATSQFSFQANVEYRTYR